MCVIAEETEHVSSAIKSCLLAVSFAILALVLLLKIVNCKCWGENFNLVYWEIILLCSVS